MGSLTVASEAVYPVEALNGETALCLFAAAFGGRQDARFLAEAGLKTTCVDIDAAELGAMVLTYPAGWEYVRADAYTYAQVTERRWDVVSLDPPTGQFDRCAAMLPRWCELARHVVILGCGDRTQLPDVDGWHVSDFRKRSSFAGGVYWAVMEHK